MTTKNESTDSEILELVRIEATKFGRCCDIPQDGLGINAHSECTQRTYAMMKGVQRVLGINKGGESMTPEEVAEARANAILRNAAPELLEAVGTAEDLFAFHEGSAERENEKEGLVVWVNNDDLERVLAVLRTAQAKATGQS